MFSDLFVDEKDLLPSTKSNEDKIIVTSISDSRDLAR
jgi:hypothetical protein